MKRNLLIVISGLLATGALLGGSYLWQHLAGPSDSGPAIISLAPDPTVTYRAIEAESPVIPPAGAMSIVAANDASGNSAIAVPPETEQKEGNADYRLPSLAKGTYRLWLRVFWQDGCGNSIGCTVVGRQLVFTDGLFGKWHWLTVPKAMDHAGGDLELSLVRRENGIMVDQILVTPDIDYVPHGIVPLR